MFTVLRDRAREERLSRRHHPDVGMPVDRARAVARRERTVEHRQVLGLQVRGPFDRVVLVDVGQDRLDLRLVVAERLAAPAGTVLLTIFSMPPPASCLYFTRAMSGSMPVVSQSIRKLIVPVGASTVAWALRKPCSRPAASTSSHNVAGRFLQIRRAGRVDLARPRRDASASRCSIGSRFSAKPSNGPTAAASSALVRLAAPCSSAVIAPQRPRAASESYGRPLDMIKLPRFE